MTGPVMAGVTSAALIRPALPGSPSRIRVKRARIKSRMDSDYPEPFEGPLGSICDAPAFSQYAYILHSSYAHSGSPDPDSAQRSRKRLGGDLRCQDRACSVLVTECGVMDSHLLASHTCSIHTLPHTQASRMPTIPKLKAQLLFHQLLASNPATLCLFVSTPLELLFIIL
jgi:hypothetical protein